MTALEEQHGHDGTKHAVGGSPLLDGDDAPHATAVLAAVPVRSWLPASLRGRDLGRLFRYGVTSLIALGISEICLVVLDAETGLGVVLVTLIANLAGTVPSYLLSRYWIWSEADRSGAGRQMLLYWLTSVVSMVVSSFAMGALSHEDHARHILKLLILGSFYFAISILLWLAKYIAYHTVIFRTPTEGPDALD